MTPRFLLFALIAAPTLAAEGWLTHLTPPDAAYRARIVLTNHAADQAPVFFTNPPLENLWTITVPARATLVYELADLPWEQPSRLYFQTAHELVDVAVRYEADFLTAPLTAAAQNQAAHAFRFPVDFSDRGWYGLALLNPSGRGGVGVDLVRYDAAGAVVDQITVTDALDGDERLLHLLSQPAETIAHVEVRADVPILVTMLHGSLPGAPAGYLTEIQPSRRSTRHFALTLQGGFTGFRHELRVEGDRARFSDLGPNTSVHEFSLSAEDRVWLDERIQHFNLADRRIAERANPGSCADAVTYRMTIFDGRVRNETIHDDCEVIIDSPLHELTNFYLEVHEWAKRQAGL